MANKVRFGELLGLYRTRCGWSQSELALKIGVHRNTIASWENGDRNPQSRGEVLRISADSLEVATAACLHLATQVLGLPEQQEAEQQIAEVKRWLQKRHGWLLILDNVENPQEILSSFVPSKHQGSVLITTRRR